MPSSLKMRTRRKPLGEVDRSCADLIPDVCGFGPLATASLPLADHGSTRNRAIVLVPRRSFWLACFWYGSCESPAQHLIYQGGVHLTIRGIGKGTAKKGGPNGDRCG